MLRFIFSCDSSGERERGWGGGGNAIVICITLGKQWSSSCIDLQGWEYILTQALQGFGLGLKEGTAEDSYLAHTTVKPGSALLKPSEDLHPSNQDQNLALTPVKPSELQRIGALPLTAAQWQYQGMVQSWWETLAWSGETSAATPSTAKGMGRNISSSHGNCFFSARRRSRVCKKDAMGGTRIFLPSQQTKQ